MRTNKSAIAPTRSWIEYSGAQSCEVEPLNLLSFGKWPLDKRMFWNVRPSHSVASRDFLPLPTSKLRAVLRLSSPDGFYLKDAFCTFQPYSLNPVHILTYLSPIRKARSISSPNSPSITDGSHPPGIQCDAFRPQANRGGPGQFRARSSLTQKPWF
jgi:hypothetical protein